MSVTAVTCTTPPLTPICGKRTITWPGTPGVVWTLKAAGQLPAWWLAGGMPATAGWLTKANPQ